MRICEKIMYTSKNKNKYIVNILQRKNHKLKPYNGKQYSFLYFFELTFFFNSVARVLNYLSNIYKYTNKIKATEPMNTYFVTKPYYNLINNM